MSQTGGSLPACPCPFLLLSHSASLLCAPCGPGTVCNTGSRGNEISVSRPHQTYILGGEVYNNQAECKVCLMRGLWGECRRWVTSRGLQLKVRSPPSRCPCSDPRQREPALWCLGVRPQDPLFGLMLHRVGPVLVFVTAKLFHKLEIEIENNLSFSFLKLPDGLSTTLPRGWRAVTSPW